MHNALATVRVIGPTIDDTALLFGPAFFPVIPAFPILYLLGMDGGAEFRKRVTLLVVLKPVGVLETAGQRITLTVEETGVVYPVEPLLRVDLNPEQQLAPSTFQVFKPITRRLSVSEHRLLDLHKGAVNIVAHFEVAHENVEHFVLRIDGLAVDGRPLVLLPIKFRKSWGLAAGM